MTLLLARQLFGKHSHTEFLENPTNALVADTSSQTDGRTDGRTDESPQKALFLLRHKKTLNEVKKVRTIYS